MYLFFLKKSFQIRIGYSTGRLSELTVNFVLYNLPLVLDMKALDPKYFQETPNSKVSNWLKFLILQLFGSTNKSMVCKEKSVNHSKLTYLFLELKAQYFQNILEYVNLLLGQSRIFQIPTIFHLFSCTKACPNTNKMRSAKENTSNGFR